jgi:hypothetical protein
VKPLENPAAFNAWLESMLPRAVDQSMAMSLGKLRKTCTQAVHSIQGKLPCSYPLELQVPVAFASIGALYSRLGWKLPPPKEIWDIFDGKKPIPW